MTRDELEDGIVEIFKEGFEKNYREYLIRYDLKRLLDDYDSDTEQYWHDYYETRKKNYD